MFTYLTVLHPPSAAKCIAWFSPEQMSPLHTPSQKLPPAMVAVTPPESVPAATMQVTCHASHRFGVNTSAVVVINEATVPEAKPMLKLPPRAQVETPPGVPWDS